MLKFFRSKLFISVILIILAGVLTFGFLPKMYGTQSETIDVVQFIDDVDLGTRISADMLVTKTIGRYGVDQSVVTTKDAIVGQYATQNIRHDTNLYSDMFTTNWNEVEGAIDTLLKEGDKLITLSVNSAAVAVGGLAKPGDIVDVLTEKPIVTEVDEYGYAVEGEEKVEMELLPLLENVMVYKFQNSALEDISELERRFYSLVEANDGSEEEFDSSLVPAFVTLIVDTEQAIKLANMEYDGTVHLVLHPDLPKEEADEPENGGTMKPATPVKPTPNADPDADPDAPETGDPSDPAGGQEPTDDTQDPDSSATPGGEGGRNR